MSSFVANLDLHVDVAAPLLADYLGQVRSAFPAVSVRWVEGTGAGQADALFYDAASIPAGVTDRIDLADLVDAEGAAAAFAEVRLLALYASAANPSALRLGPASVDPFPLTTSGALVVPAGSTVYPLLCPVDGAWPVAGGADSIDVTNPGGTAATYQILIIGTTA